MPSQLNKLLFSLKKGKHRSKQTATHNNPASHGKCCCFVHWNGAALFTRVLMVCMEILTLGEAFHCSNSSPAGPEKQKDVSAHRQSGVCRVGLTFGEILFCSAAQL